jgi:hypothetical protein
MWLSPANSLRTSRSRGIVLPAIQLVYAIDALSPTPFGQYTQDTPLVRHRRGPLAFPETDRTSRHDRTILGGRRQGHLNNRDTIELVLRA